MTASVVNAPRDYVRALTCGMTKADRERRLLVMLRAYLDESSSGDSHGRFVIAGFVAFCHEWEDFAELWAAVLAAPPSVPYFRMSSFRSEEWRKEHGITKAL